jgi:hypothetical protein
MNTNAFMGILRAVVPAAVSWAVAKGWIPGDSVADVTAALVAVGAAGWSVITNLEAGHKN